MKIPSQRKYIPLFILLLACAMLFVMLIIPSEQSLGKTFKLVFLHAALIQTGLIFFTVAAIWTISCLFNKNEKYYRFCLVTQKTGVVILILYVLSSMLVTYLAWGKAIAWNEPRVQSSALVLFFAILFLILTMWINNQKFTAAANVMMAVLAWGLTKQAGIVQHPANPIGSSDSASLKVYFYVLFVMALLPAAQISRLFNKPEIKEH